MKTQISQTFTEFLNESADYEIYNDTYSKAIAEILKYADTRGYLLDDLNTHYEGEQIDNLVTTGPGKPKPGMTHKLDLDLYKKRVNKDGVILYPLQKKILHAQIYNRETNGNAYELNMYIN